jgi:DNA primase
VTEGLIDCAMIGKQGTTMLGVEASDMFIKALLKMTNRKIIMAYDNDAPGRKALKKFMRESKYNKRVLYFLMPKEYKYVKDLNELRKININENKIGELYNFVVDNSFSYLKTTSKLILEEKCG